MSTDSAVRIAVSELYRSIPAYSDGPKPPCDDSHVVAMSLPDSPRYRITTTGNGYFVTIYRLIDGESVFLQGDDAGAFCDRMESTHDRFTNDDLADEYFA